MRFAQHLLEGPNQCCVVDLRAGGQDAQVGAVGALYVGVGGEPLVEPFEHRGGEERSAVLVGGERAGLPDQRLDQVPPADRVPLTVEPHG